MLSFVKPSVSVITLGVADLERSLRFYRDGLGWSPSSASAGDFVLFRTAGAAVALYPREELARDARLPAEPSAPFAGVTLAQNVRSRGEVDAAIAAAVRAGATLLKAGVETSWGGYSGYVADPDGHAWEIAWNPHIALGPDGLLRLDD